MLHVFQLNVLKIIVQLNVCVSNSI